MKLYLDVTTLRPYRHMTLSVKMKMRYRDIPEDEEWRLPILNEMIFARDHHIEIEGLTRRDITDIIKYVCTA